MVKRIFFILTFFVVMLLAWQFFEDRANLRLINNNHTSLEAFIPTPITIFHTFVSDWKKILRELSFTLKKAGIGFLLGFGFAVVLSVVFLYMPFFRNLVLPLAFAVNSFPIVGFAPIVILIFGQGTSQSIIFISALISYFPTMISMDVAFKETDKGIMEYLDTLNASRIQKFLKVQLPCSFPYLFISMKLAIPASIIGATIGEWFGTRNGIGQLITISLYQLKPGLMYASLLSVAFVSSFFVFSLSLAQHFLIPWNRNKHG